MSLLIGRTSRASVVGQPPDRNLTTPLRGQQSSLLQLIESVDHSLVAETEDISNLASEQDRIVCLDELFKYLVVVDRLLAAPRHLCDVPAQDTYALVTTSWAGQTNPVAANSWMQTTKWSRLLTYTQPTSRQQSGEDGQTALAAPAGRWCEFERMSEHTSAGNESRARPDASTQLNSDDRERLQTLDGVGPVTADRLAQEFRSIGEIIRTALEAYGGATWSRVDNDDDALARFERVDGVGHARAQSLAQTIVEELTDVGDVLRQERQCGRLVTDGGRDADDESDRGHRHALPDVEMLEPSEVEEKISSVDDPGSLNVLLDDERLCENRSEVIAAIEDRLAAVRSDESDNDPEVRADGGVQRDTRAEQRRRVHRALGQLLEADHGPHRQTTVTSREIARRDSDLTPSAVGRWLSTLCGDDPFYGGERPSAVFDLELWSDTGARRRWMVSDRLPDGTVDEFVSESFGSGPTAEVMTDGGMPAWHGTTFVSEDPDSQLLPEIEDLNPEDDAAYATVQAGELVGVLSNIDRQCVELAIHEDSHSVLLGTHNHCDGRDGCDDCLEDDSPDADADPISPRADSALIVSKMIHCGGCSWTSVHLRQLLAAAEKCPRAELHIQIVGEQQPAVVGTPNGAWWCLPHFHPGREDDFDRGDGVETDGGVRVDHPDRECADCGVAIQSVDTGENYLIYDPDSNTILAGPFDTRKEAREVSGDSGERVVVPSDLYRVLHESGEIVAWADSGPDARAAYSDADGCVELLKPGETPNGYVVPWDEQCPECGRASLLTVDIGVEGPVSDVPVGELEGERLADEHRTVSRLIHTPGFSPAERPLWWRWACDRVTELWDECCDRSSISQPECHECESKTWKRDDDGWFCAVCDARPDPRSRWQEIEESHEQILDDVRDGAGWDDDGDDDGPGGPGAAPVATDGGFVHTHVDEYLRAVGEDDILDLGADQQELGEQV